MEKRSKRLFIVCADDDQDDQMLFQEALQATGYSHLLHQVYNGALLIQFLEDGAKEQRLLPDLIFLDLNMPVKDGRETLRSIKAAKSPYKNIPVIVLTTSNSMADIETCYEYGANLFVVKPSSFNELSRILKGFMELFSGAIQLPDSSIRV